MTTKIDQTSEQTDSEQTWLQITTDIASMSAAIRGFEDLNKHQQEMMTEIMLRCCQRLTISLEDELAKKS